VGNKNIFRNLILVAFAALVFLVLSNRTYAAPYDVTDYTTPTPNSYPNGIVTGPDGNIWFTQYGGNNIAKLVIATGVITEYPVPTANSHPDFITSGLDGNLWFTENAVNKVAKINAVTGDITEYTIPTAASGPHGITTGLDGMIWFTESSGNKVAKINPNTGDITEYTIPTLNSQPHRLTTAQDGTIWFTEYNTNKVAKINPNTGDITEYTVPSGFDGLSAITMGKDGIVWFSEEDVAQIGKIDPFDGVINEYPIPGVVDWSGPKGATTTSDGNIWFTIYYADKIGKINPLTNDFTLYDLGGTGLYPYDITVGPDNNLWFVKNNSDKISRFELPVIHTTNNSPDGSVVELDTPEGTNITCNNMVTESSLNLDDPGRTYPHGLLDFCFTTTSGATNEVSVTFQTDLLPSQVTARKYVSSTNTYLDVPGAVITETTINGNHALKVTYSITDGGILDDDGLANGTVLDPIGLAVTSATLASTGQNTIYIIITAVLMIIFSSLFIARKKTFQFITNS